MSGGPWARPAAGREPAAAALLGWLADPDAPRLCVVSGGAGCGKSTLLAWLVGHGTRPVTAPARRVHAFVPLAGQGVRGTVWTLAEQLGVVARAPGELLAALAADERRTVIVLPDLHAAVDAEAVAALVSSLVGPGHVRLLVEARAGHDAVRLLDACGPAVLDLDEERWTDPVRRAAWQATQAASGRLPGSPEPDGPEPDGPPAAGAPDLGDPAVVCAADPVRVTAAYETGTDRCGGLRAAWLRAGQSLMRDQSPAERALVLLTVLGDGADPRMRPALAELSAGVPWEPVWFRIRGDVTPPWPGPALALATGPGPLDGRFLVADHQGVLRTAALTDAAATGRLPRPVPGVTALCALADGTVWALDDQGRLHTRRLPTAGGPSGLAALLGDTPSPGDAAAERLTARLADVPGSALAASGRAAAAGGVDGAVYAVFLDEDGTAPRTAHLHRGRVTALGVVDVPAGESGHVTPLVYSGGVDGRVRVWAPGGEPMAVPVVERSCAVAALGCALTPSGPALAVGWADGLVEYHRLGTGETRAFHPGQPVNALALTPDERLLIGTDEAVLCLRPR
ncbi:hypothetical protein AB0941_05215 [Streptomyces sp. NPDC013433]|uniref:hypothetical protein n=1 Tax=Streptomyces sp. NPDC013433 TaxID=3155604 RepID=UPI0034553548